MNLQKGSNQPDAVFFAERRHAAQAVETAAPLQTHKKGFRLIQQMMRYSQRTDAVIPAPAAKKAVTGSTRRFFNAFFRLFPLPD